MSYKVSFGAISTDPTIKLQDTTITQQQSYSAGSSTSAAAEVKSDTFEKKGNAGKVALGILATAAAALTAIALTVKFKGLKSTELAEDAKFLEKIKNGTIKVGEKINKGAKRVIDSITGLFNKKKPEAPKGTGALPGKPLGFDPDRNPEILNGLRNNAPQKPLELPAGQEPLLLPEKASRNVIEMPAASTGPGSGQLLLPERTATGLKEDEVKQAFEDSVKQVIAKNTETGAQATAEQIADNAITEGANVVKETTKGTNAQLNQPGILETAGKMIKDKVSSLFGKFFN